MRYTERNRKAGMYYRGNRLVRDETAFDRKFTRVIQKVFSSAVQIFIGRSSAPKASPPNPSDCGRILANKRWG